MKLRQLSAAIVLACGLTACSDDADDAANNAATQNAPAAKVSQSTESTLLKYIPANSPYVLANTESVSEEDMDSIWKVAEQAMGIYNQMLDQTLEDLRSKSAEERSEDDETTIAVLEMFEGKLNREGLESMGFSSNGNYAIYGDGILPTLRMQLDDPMKMEQTLEELEAKLDGDMQKGMHSNVAYRYIEDEKGEARVVTVVKDGQFIMGIVPAKANDAVMSNLLGASMPDQNITNRLIDINAQHNLMGAGTFLMDIPRAIDYVLNDESEVAMALFGEDRADISDACRAEYAEMGGIMPQIISGYREINSDEIEQWAMFELRSDLAEALSTVFRPVAPMNTEEGMFSFAMGFSIPAMKQFVQDRVAAMQADPYECEHLADMNNNLEQMSQQLNQPLPPFVGNIQGIRMQLESMNFEGQMPTDYKGQMMIAMVNPQMMLGMAQAFVPSLATLNLQQDGTPVALPEGTVPAEIESPYIAMTQGGIAMSVGEGGDAKLKSFLSSEPDANGPFMMVGYDAETFMELQEKGMNQSLTQAGMDAIDLGEASYDRVSAEVFMNEKGVEMTSSTYLK